MAKTININEHGSNRKLSIVVSNILYVEPLLLSSGVWVTVITLVGDKQILATENVVNVQGQINNSD